MTLFHAFIVRPLRRQPLRTAATIASLAVGVGVVVAIQLANASSVSGFATALNAVAGQTSLEITADGGSVDEARLAGMEWLRGYGRVSPVIDADVLLDVGEVTETVRLLGVDILRDRPFRDYPLVDDGPDGAELNETTDSFLDRLTDPQSVMLTRRFGDRHGLTVGAGAALLIGDRTVPLRVTGLLGDDGPAQVLNGNFALMDIAAAQWAMGSLGYVDRVDVRLRDGVAVADAEQEIAARLPAGLSVRRPSSRGAEVERMLRAFHFNLTALSLIALLVGLFLVYNTVSVSVITRRAEIGLLRTAGTTRATIVVLFLGEAAVLALIGCAIGAPLGWLMAHGAVGLTSSTVSQFWIASAARVPALDLPMIVLAFGVGLPLALLAAAAPALEAAGVPPLAAVRGDRDVEARARVPWRPAAGAVALFLLGIWLATWPPVGELPLGGMLAALAVVLGAACLMPVVLFVFREAAGRPMGRWLGVEGRLAHANLGSAIPRLSISVAALSVSLAMMVAIAVMVGSFRETVAYWVGQTLQADLFVSAARGGPVARRGGLSEETESVLRAHPAVLAIDGFTAVETRYEGSVITVGSGRFDVLREHGALLFKAPADGQAALARAAETGGVVVTESFSLKHRVAPGDRITLPTPQGPAAFRVEGIYFDYSNDRGIASMDDGTFVRHFDSKRPAGLTLYLRPDADPEVVQDELRAALGPDRRVFITTNRSLRATVLEIFDATFAITWALEAIAIAVAMFGIAATLLALALERRREITMLRLAGAERRHVRRMVVIEAVVLGAVTQGVGLMVGLALSLILIYVINVQSFGWTIQFDLPVAFLAQSTAAVLAATALAGLWPARLAAGFDLAGLRDDA